MIKGDCLKEMQEISDKSVDLILCDLPYGTTPCKWDKIINFEKLWEQYIRIIKDKGVVVLFSNQPFTSKLIMSNLKYYKYNWVWVKNKAANFLNSKYQPFKITEDICVFSKSACAPNSKGISSNYYPILEQGKPYSISAKIHKPCATVRSNFKEVGCTNNGTRLPNNVLYFSKDKEKLTPTQKPVKLLEYLIKTYTKENDIVMDNCAGSFSCGIACMNTGRNFIGIEKDENFFKIGMENTFRQIFR